LTFKKKRVKSKLVLGLVLSGTIGIGFKTAKNGVN